MPLAFLVYYYLFFKADNPETYILNSKELINDLRNLSFWFFTAGVFSAASKLLSHLVIFKNQFKKVIMSDEFDELLTRKLEVLTFSHENLNRQSNLDEIWRKVTLCKYEQSFPHLMSKLHENLVNELFEENNLSYYYKNMRTQANIELVAENIVQIVEIASYTVITNSKSPIEMRFFLSSGSSDTAHVFTRIDPTRTSIDGVPFDANTFDNIPAVYKGEEYVKTYTHKLEGKTEYHIERYIVMQQDLGKDRIYSFSSTKIIDDIYVHLQPCKKLGIEFSGIGKNRFSKDNMKLEGQAHVNRDLLMPGEMFKVFIYMK